jgi:hypothetical protein
MAHTDIGPAKMRVNVRAVWTGAGVGLSVRPGPLPSASMVSDPQHQAAPVSVRPQVKCSPTARSVNRNPPATGTGSAAQGGYGGSL